MKRATNACRTHSARCWATAVGSDGQAVPHRRQCGPAAHRRPVAGTGSVSVKPNGHVGLAQPVKVGMAAARAFSTLMAMWRAAMGISWNGRYPWVSAARTSFFMSGPQPMCALTLQR
jgi:hypothetical protein